MSHAFIHIYPPLNVESKSKIVYSSKTKVDERGKSVAKIENGKNQFKTNPNNHVKQRVESLRLQGLLFPQKLERCAQADGVPCKFDRRWSDVTQSFIPVVRLQYAETIATKVLGLKPQKGSNVMTVFKQHCIKWNMVDISGHKLTNKSANNSLQYDDTLKFEFAAKHLEIGQLHLMRNVYDEGRQTENNRARLVSMSRNIRQVISSIVPLLTLSFLLLPFLNPKQHNIVLEDWHQNFLACCD